MRRRWTAAGPGRASRRRTDQHARNHWCGGRRRDLPRCRWAVAGPGRASRRRAERSSRRGRLAGGQDSRRPEIRRRHKQHKQESFPTGRHTVFVLISYLVPLVFPSSSITKRGKRVSRWSNTLPLRCLLSLANKEKTPEPGQVPGSGGGGWGIRTPEGLHPTRFPSVRHRPLGESSVHIVPDNHKRKKTPSANPGQWTRSQDRNVAK